MSQHLRQSGISYLRTEADLQQELGMEVLYPIRAFDLSGIGVNSERFLKDLSESFDRLAWDLYDVKRAQVSFLKERFPVDSAWLEAFLVNYWSDEVSVIDLIPYFRQLSIQDKIAFERLRSYRRRSIAKFELTNRKVGNWEEQWHVARTKCHGFTQDVNGGDLRSSERIFDPTAAEVVEHIEFQRLLIAVAEMVEDAESDAKRDVHDLTLTLHQMGLIALPGSSSTNAPEGLHQDGADYIISALVVSREGVVGGKSYITGADKQTALLEVTLYPGQGIFQADKGSTLWHNVTPIQTQTEDVDPGSRAVRNIFGFDITIRRE